MPKILQLESAFRPARDLADQLRAALVLALIVAAGTTALPGCAGLKTRAELSSRRTGKPPATGVFGEEVQSADAGPLQTPDAEAEVEPVATQAAPVIRPAVLIFGPGQSRALAAFGVLQGWQEAGLPVAEIYASETSALVAALFASSRTVSECEWKLLKIRAECFVDDDSVLSGFFSRKQTSACIEEAIDAAFGKTTFRDLRIPLRVGYEEPAGEVVWANSGSLANALKNSYRSGALHGAVDLPHSIRSETAFPVRRIRDSFSGPVVAVDFFEASQSPHVSRASKGRGVRGSVSDALPAGLKEGERAFESEMREVSSRSRDSLKEADFFWSPLDGRLGLPFLDHHRRQEAIAAGRASFEDHLHALSTLTGVSHE